MANQGKFKTFKIIADPLEFVKYGGEKWTVQFRDAEEIGGIVRAEKPYNQYLFLPFDKNPINGDPLLLNDAMCYVIGSFLVVLNRYKTWRDDRKKRFMKDLLSQLNSIPGRKYEGDTNGKAILKTSNSNRRG